MSIYVNYQKPDYIKHGDFTFDDEQVNEVARDYEVVNKKKGFLHQFTSKGEEVNGDLLTVRTQVLLDPTAVADLNEGDDPRQDSIKVISHTLKTRSFGSYIPYGRHAMKRNRDAILPMCSRQLAHNRLYDAEATRFIAFNTATYSASIAFASNKPDWWNSLTNLGIRLDKNGGKGGRTLLCTPEIAADIAREMKASNTLLTGSQEGVELFREGYLGDYCGFHIVKCHEPYMYREVSGSRYMLAFAFCKTEDGTWPVKDSGMGSDPTGEVIIKALGESGLFDPTNEIGTIASRLDYVAAYIDHPECIIRLTNIAVGSGNNQIVEVSSDMPGAYYLEENSSTGVGKSIHSEFGKVISPESAFDATVSVVAASNGSAISSPTVVIKKGSSSGDTVSPSSGKYALEANKVYYYSVSKTNYVTQTGTFKADPSEPNIVFKLVASE